MRTDQFSHPTKPPQNKTARAYGRMYAWVRAQIAARRTVSAPDLAPVLGQTRAATALANMFRRGELVRTQRGAAGNPNWPGVGRSAVYRKIQR